MLRSSLIQFPSNFQDIACWVDIIQWRSCYQSEEIKILHSLKENRTHSRSVKNQTNMLCTTTVSFIILITWLSYRKSSDCIEIELVDLLALLYTIVHWFLIITMQLFVMLFGFEVLFDVLLKTLIQKVTFPILLSNFTFFYYFSYTLTRI